MPLLDPPWHMLGIPPTLQLQILVLQHCLDAITIVPEHAPAALPAEPGLRKPDGVAPPQVSVPAAIEIAVAAPNNTAKLAINRAIRSKRMSSPCLLCCLGSEAININ